MKLLNEGKLLTKILQSQEASDAEKYYFLFLLNLNCRTKTGFQRGYMGNLKILSAEIVAKTDGGKLSDPELATIASGMNAKKLL